MCDSFLFFFFNDTAPTEIYTLSLHDALPICHVLPARRLPYPDGAVGARRRDPLPVRAVRGRSEEHTSELQSRRDLVCRLLLEKKKDPWPLRYTHPHSPSSHST